MFTSLFRILPVFVFLVGGVAAAQALVSGPDAPPAQKAQLDEQTRQLLGALKANLQKAQTHEFSAQSSVKMEASGMNRESATTYTVAAKQPNKLLVKCEGGNLDGLTLLSDGTTYYTYAAPVKKFRKEAAPKQLADLAAEGYLPNDPMLGFVTAFVEGDPLASVLEGVSRGRYVGKETIESVECEHMSFSLPDMDWDLWIRSGDSPVPVRIKPDITKSLAQEAPQMGEIKVDMVINYVNWTMGQDLPDERFAFNAEGNEEVKEPQHPLVGKPAPGFTLSLLDGTKATLAQHKGKDVVVLDFWATWCKYCHQLMPIVEKVVHEFKDQNVVLYAVNNGEETELVKQFADATAMNAPIALDTDKAVSNLYQAENLPYMIVVGKDGLIQAVYTGMGPSSERRLRSTLKALAAGKSLVEPAPAVQPAP